MRIKEEYYLESQLHKRKEINEMEDGLKRGGVGQGDTKSYVPTSGIKIERS